MRKLKKSMLYINTIFMPWILKLWSILCAGATALPLITALGLIVGRRGNGAFCLLGSSHLLTLCAGMGITGIFYFPLRYLADIAGFEIAGSRWGLLATPAGYSYWCAALAWILALACVLWACRQLRALRAHLPLAGDKYRFSFIRWPFAFLLLGCVFYLLSLCLENWPFAGLPEGLGWDRAIMAILRHALRQYFMDFCPAGAIALLFAPYWLATDNFSSFGREKTYAIRWLALWAFIGCLPYSLQLWGIMLGLGLRGNPAGNMPLGLDLQLASLSCLTLGIACWGFTLLAKSSPRWLAWAGFGCLILRDSAPWIIKTFRHIF